MTEAVTHRTPRLARLLRRKLFWGVVSVPLAIAGISGWLTEPLETKPSTPADKASEHKIPPAPRPDIEAVAEWPTAAMSGRPATQLLLTSLRAAQSRLETAGGYKAVFRKTERIKGVLGDEQILEMKCRHEPFGIYFKFRKPEPGKEVVYSVGHYDDEVIAHSTGFARTLVPRLKVAPTSAIAMAGNRHPITEAGLLNLTKRLIGFRELDLQDPDASTILDRVKDDSGREWLRSVHTHPHQKSDRPFQLVEVMYDPTTRIPLHIRNFDWPAPGAKPSADPKLAESYRYDDLELGAELSDIDFDPANPAYDFRRL